MDLKTRFYITVAFIVIAVVLHLHASAQQAPFMFPAEPEEPPVKVKALKIDYNKQGNLLIARGRVELTQGNRTLNADYIKVNLKTNDAYAKGNVLLNEGGDLLACDEFTLNLDTQKGAVQNAKVFIKKENFHINGNEMKSLGQDTYQVKDGIITTCDGENPVWRLDAKKIDVTIDGYAKIRNSTFRIKGVPVMYFPYFIMPVKTTRQTGLLLPEIGTSRKKGFEFNNSLFWAISPNTDATFYLDTASRKGAGEGLEYRFVLGENSWGKLFGYFAKEENSYFENAYSHIRDRNQERGILHFEGEHYFSPDFYIKSFGSYITDREFYNDYSSEARRSKSEWDRGKFRSLEKDESFVFATKNWDFYSLLVNVDLYKNLVERDEQTLQRAPQVSFSSIRQPIGKTPVFFQWDSAYDYFWREEGLKGNRIDIFPKISLPYNKGGWFTFNPEIGLRGMSYFGLNENHDLDKNGFFPELHAEAYLTFLRIFSFSGKQIEKLKHTIEPRLEYEYAPDFNQEDYPKFDVPDKFYKRHSITYSVTNRFTGLMVDETGAPFDRELGYFKIGQTYNMRRPEGGLYLDGDPHDKLGDLFGELRLNINPTLYVKTKAGYDPNDNDLSFYNALITWDNNRDEFLDLEYRYERKHLEIWNAKGKLRVFEPVYAFFDSRYNMLDSRKLDNEFGIDYRAQCWGAKVSFYRNSEIGGTKGNTGVKFNVYLKGMGETQRGLGEKGR